MDAAYRRVCARAAAIAGVPDGHAPEDPLFGFEMRASKNGDEALREELEGLVDPEDLEDATESIKAMTVQLLTTLLLSSDNLVHVTLLVGQVFATGVYYEREGTS
jgi:hypothetical protein